MSEERTIWRNIVLILITSAILSFPLQFLKWYLPIAIKEVGGLYAIAMIYPISYLSSLTGPIGGVMSDVIGRKPLAIAGALVCLVGFSVPSLLPQLPALLLLLISPLIGSHISAPATASLLAESTKERRGLVFSLSRMVSLASLTAGSAVLGLVVDSWGLSKVLRLYAVLGLVSVLMRMFLIETKKLSNPSPTHRAFRALASVKHIVFGDALPLTLVVAIFALSQSIIDIYLPLHFREVVGLNAALIGLFFATYSFATTVSNPLAGYLIDKYGEKLGYLSYIFSMVTSYVLYLLLLKVSGAYVAMVPLFLSAFGSASFSVAYLVYISRITSSDNRGTILSIYNTITTVSMIPGPLIGTYMWSITPNLPLIGTILALLACTPLIPKFKEKPTHSESE